MQVNSQCVKPDGVLHGVLPVLFCQTDFLVLDGPAGIGDINRAVDERGNSCAGSTAANGDDDRGIDKLIRLRPGLGYVDQGIGTLVLNDLASLTPTAGAEGYRQSKENNQNNSSDRHAILLSK